MSFYKEYIHKLNVFVRKTLPDTQQFGAACLSQQQWTSFETTYNYNAVDDAINKMLALDDNLFFLPSSSHSNDLLLSMSSDQQKLVDDAWNETTSELNKKPTEELTEKVAVLPRTLPFFHDPGKLDVKGEYDTLVNTNATYNVEWSARLMVTKAIGMAIRMKLLGVSNEDSLRILEHCVGHVFNAIRNFRQESDVLMVTNVYFPWYESAFKNLTHGINADSVPEIPVSIIQTVLGQEVELLSSFNSWGKLTYFNFDLHFVSLLSIESHIFHPNVLADIANDIGISYSGRRLKPEKRITGVQRNPVSCDPDIYYFFDGFPLSTSSPWEKCCALFCSNVDLLSITSVTSESTCCQNCNQENCVLDGSNPLEVLSFVVLVIFGFDTRESISVMI